jgi:hypothetical protein
MYVCTCSVETCSRGGLGKFPLLPKENGVREGPDNAIGWRCPPEESTDQTEGLISRASESHECENE